MDPARVLRRLGGGRSIVIWIVSGKVNIIRQQKWRHRASSWWAGVVVVVDIVGLPRASA